MLESTIYIIDSCGDVIFVRHKGKGKNKNLNYLRANQIKASITIITANCRASQRKSIILSAVLSQKKK